MASRRLCGGWTNCAVVYLVQSHAVYTVFTKGYKSKFTYFMRSISVESFEDYVDPAASRSITAPQVDSITAQSMFMVAGENSIEELKRQHQALKTASVKMRMESIDSSLPSDLLRSVNQSRDKNASSWLTAVPLFDQGLVLNKQEFRDSLRLRYNMPLSDLGQASVFVVRSIPSATPCHVKRKGS